MIKIKYLPTGNIFVLPEKEAEELKKKAPNEYKIIEKNGRKVKDNPKPSKPQTDKSILTLVLDNDARPEKKRRKK